MLMTPQEVKGSHALGCEFCPQGLTLRDFIVSLLCMCPSVPADLASKDYSNEVPASGSNLKVYFSLGSLFVGSLPSVPL